MADHSSLDDSVVASLHIEGSHVTVRNVAVKGAVLVTGDHVRLDNVSARGIAISRATDVSVERSDIARSPADGIYVTSDGPDLARNTVLSHNLVRAPRVSADAHDDGVQVRGVRVGGDLKWGTCYLGDGVGDVRPHEEGNTALDDGQALELCPDEPDSTE